MTEQLMNLNESSQMQIKQNEELKQMIADLHAYSGGYPFSISGDIRSVPS